MTAANRQRFLALLDVVRREGLHLQGTAARLAAEAIDAAWVATLEQRHEVAERVDAFAARFGRMQDTLGDKLIPEFLRQMAETPGTALDNLRRLEKLELLDSAEDWLEARNLRNRLVHEYVRDAGEFAGALQRAQELLPLLIATYNRINRSARERLAIADEDWPALLP